MKADFEAQEGSNLVSSGGASAGSNRKGRAEKRQTMREMQWRPTGVSALPDRLVATGRRVEMVDLV